MKLKNWLAGRPIYELILYAFLVVLPFQTRIIYSPASAYINGDYFSYPLAYFLHLSDILFFTLLVSYLLFLRNNVSQESTIMIPGVLFILWVMITLLHVKHIGSGVYQSFKWLEFVIVTWLIAEIVKSKNIFEISSLIIYVSGIFQAILGIWQFHVQHGVGLTLLGEYVPNILVLGAATIETFHGKLLRAYGTFPHPNVFGSFLVVSLTFGLYYVSRATEQKSKIILSLGNLILLVGIFLSFSRVAWISAATATLLIMFHGKSLRNLRTIGFTALIACGTIVGLWNKLLFQRVSNITTDNSYVLRGTFNNFGWNVIKQYPIAGSGVGNYIQTIQDMFHVQPWQYQPPHNIFVYLAASLGLVGLGFFLYYLWSVLRSIWNTNASDLKFTLIVLFFILIFMSNFDHFLVTIQQGQLLFFTCLGLIAAYKNLDASSN